MNVVVNGLLANHQKTGKGKKLVFLHGWGDSSLTFSKIAEELSNEFEIYSLDLPGFGGTQAPPEPWKLQDYADFVNAWMAKVGLKPMGLVGHSYGGAVAVIIASANPDIKKLVLLASAGVRKKHGVRKKTMKAAAKLGKVPLYALPASKRQKIRRRLYRLIGSDMMLMPGMEQTFKRIVGEDVQAAAAKIKARTLLIYGSKDKTTPVSDGQTLSRAIPHSRLDVIDAGHNLHQQQPDIVISMIKGLLKGK